MGLLQALGVPDWTAAGKYLAANYLDDNDEKGRRAHCARLARLYENRAEKDLEDLVATAFKSEVTKALRKRLVKWAKWNNLTARIVNEKATVYAEPAVRHVADDEVYQRFLELVPMDETMRAADRMLGLFEDIWIQYRVRATGDAPDDREPLVDIIDPSKFWAVHAPADRTRLVAVIIDQCPGDSAAATDPHYLVWLDDESLFLDKEFRVITTSVAPWPLGKMPGLLASMVPPNAKQRLLAREPSADLAAAHDAVSFQNLLLLKESKSANKQTYLTGDVSAATMGQPADTETDVVLPEGVVPTTIDRGMNLEQFSRNSREISETAGANHGLPPSVMNHRDASSGAEIELRRIPIRELRKQRIPIFRRIERKLCAIQAMVNETDLPAFAFKAVGFTVDFGEVQGVLTESERDTVFEKRRGLLLTDTVEEEMRRNPDLRSPREAVERITERVKNEAMRLELMQALQRLNGGTSTTPGAPTPEQNGAAGAAAGAPPEPAA
jgi:hypothetical protein